MDASPTIAVIARDEGLLDSLTFLLGVEGFRVDAASRAPAAIPGGGWLCAVVDSGVTLPADLFAGSTTPVIFLSDQLSPPPAAADVRVLAKPFQASELLDVIAGLRTRV